MKLKNIKIKNFKGMQAVEVSFGKQVTHLVGMNGAGKSTLFDAIWAAFRGVGSKGEMLIGDRFRVIGGHGKTADIEVTLIDEKNNNEKIKIVRKISKSANTMKIEAAPGYNIDNEWVRNLLSVAFFNAYNFIQKSGLEQSKLLGIDTKEFDDKMATLKEHYTDINREYRRLGAIEEPDKVRAVDVSALLDEKNAALEFNKKQLAKSDEILSSGDEVAVIKGDIASLKNKLELKERALVTAEKYHRNLPDPEPDIDWMVIDDKIKAASEINAKAANYAHYMKTKEKEGQIIDMLNKCRDDQQKVDADKAAYVQAQLSGMEGVGVDENGGLLAYDKDGKARPINRGEFSTGELYRIVFLLYAATKPELKTVFIDNFENLDPKNQERLIDSAEILGFQVITASVGVVANDNSSVLLRECKVVG